MLTVHIQCLVRVSGSILAGVFLTSFFCVVLEYSYFSDAASSSLLVPWHLNCSSAASSTKSTVASETGVVLLHRSLCSGVTLIYITATHRQTVAVMVSYNTILCDFYGDSLEFLVDLRVVHMK